MKKNILIIITISLTILLSISYIDKSQKKYQNKIIESNSKIIANIIEKYPYLENEIIDTILLNKGNVVLGQQILDKYGIDEISIENINQINKIECETKKNIVILILLSTSIISIIFILKIKKRNKEINKINLYLDKILKNDYSMDIRDYQEGYISKLKNDIYKITILLKEKEAYSNKEKKHLESILSDISHQLKTPLTSMFVINDILSNDLIDKDKKKEMLNKNKIQLERIEWLVTSLLKLSRLDSDMVIMKKETINIDDLINRALEPLRIPIELKEQNIIIKNNDQISINIDINWTTEALINIFKNAHEHTNKQGNIEISYINNPIYVELTIKDNGEGINKKDLPHIFERFYKGNNNSESIGIGLNMAKTIISKQNGYITVESEEKKYTKFAIKFYKNEI